MTKSTRLLATVTGLLFLSQTGRLVLAQPPSIAGDTGPVPLCRGDCNGDGSVTIDEITQIVNVVLGGNATTCARVYPFPDVDVRWAVVAVNSALRGCQTFTYHLVPGSSITYSPDGGPVIVEPLTGTFVAVPAVNGDPNSIFYFTIADVQLNSSSFAVRGHGFIRTYTLTPDGAILPFVSASVNQEVANFCGIAPFSVLSGDCPEYPLCEYPPGFEGLDICATNDPSFCGSPTCDAIREGTRTGYSITLIAVPEGGADRTEVRPPS